ncbi:MAG: 4Fe-4S binding protein [Halobacteriovoraceae bacterium]|nr:4Fe-4S binding protein [Halobacteriovoraceae bacterium]MBT5093455.1 4Fe-4S binding protein [Halobacteriovoraceae bacterium]
MIPILEINSTCIACDNCLYICPENAVLKNKNQYAIETWSCTLCNFCVEVCPVDCIKLIEKSEKTLFAG